MKTRKLYYEDCHRTQFCARVLSCLQTKKGWEVVLDATVFYPEGGGQACDLGTLGGANVKDVYERVDVVVHLCDAPLAVGSDVQGKIDYARRFHLMQQHSGEHIVSGIIHARYGYHNVGFHMGAEGMVIDFDGVIAPEDLAQIELEANRAVWNNVPISCTYPPEDELSKIAYRSKKALAYPVRIVEVAGYDCCACCGVHVASTGEIGVVKLLSCVPFRGGSRIEMVCGAQAFDVLKTAFDQNRLVSQAFSAAWQQTGAAARRMNETLDVQRAAYAALEGRMRRMIAQTYAGSGDVLHFEEDLAPTAIRELADAIAQCCGGVAAVFSGNDASGYGYAIVSRDTDVRALGEALNAALCGRGGGKPNFRQGRVQTRKCEIEAFFASKNV